MFRTSYFSGELFLALKAFVAVAAAFGFGHSSVFYMMRAEIACFKDVGIANVCFFVLFHAVAGSEAFSANRAEKVNY